MQYVYLAGAISGLTYDQATDWRADARKKLPTWIDTISPLRGKAFLKSKGNIADHYDENHLTSVKGINTRDFNDVKRSSAVFVNLLGTKKVSIGTVMEIAWAAAFKIPVICVMEKDNLHHHCMLDYACGYIVEDLHAGYNTLVHLLGTDTQVTMFEQLLSVKAPAPKQDETPALKWLEDLVKSGQVKKPEPKTATDSWFEKMNRDAENRRMMIDKSNLNPKSNFWTRFDQIQNCPDPKQKDYELKKLFNQSTSDNVNVRYLVGVDPANTKETEPIMFRILHGEPGNIKGDKHVASYKARQTGKMLATLENILADIERSSK